MKIKKNDKVTFQGKYGNFWEGIIIDPNYQCDFDEDLNGCVQLKVYHDTYNIGWVNTIIDKSQILKI